MWSGPKVGCSSRQSWVQITLLSTGVVRASVLLVYFLSPAEHSDPWASCSFLAKLP